jgi:hypothetical protein
MYRHRVGSALWVGAVVFLLLPVLQDGADATGLFDSRVV